MKFLLDTHILLWWLAESDALSRDQGDALARAESAGEQVGVAAITLWEIAKLVERGRITMPRAIDDVLESLERHPLLAVLPLSARVALESTRLGPDFHRDPADQMIVATARVHGLRLLTADERIRASRRVAVV